MQLLVWFLMAGTVLVFSLHCFSGASRFDLPKAQNIGTHVTAPKAETTALGPDETSDPAAAAQPKAQSVPNVVNARAWLWGFGR
jgi:hypothetical protein